MKKGVFIALSVFFLVLIFCGIKSILFSQNELQPDFSVIITDKDGMWLRTYLNNDDKWCFQTKYDEISPLFLETLIKIEDKRFRKHFGVDILAISRAFFSNLKSRRVVSGASTLTMQTCRLLKPKKRTVFNKILEMIQASYLELILSKNQILELYLNLTPYGSNIVGLKSAAYFYFGETDLKNLTPAQTALLVAIPNSPNKYDPARNYRKSYEKRNEILENMIELKIISNREYERALKEPLIRDKFPAPIDAPLFCNFIYNKYPDKNMIETTLDFKLQEFARFSLNKILNKTGIHNGAVVIIDNKSHSISAMVGTADFYDEREGKINGALALRSPGSTLKPFIYTSAFENGIIAEKTKLPDVEIQISGYSPKNYDKIYRGYVSADKALYHSLNIPAIYLLNELEKNNFNFVSKLKELNITTLDENDNNFGLAIGLGGVGINLLELTNAYTIFSNKGELHNIRYLSDETSELERKVFSEESVYITNEILTQVIRPDFDSCWEFLPQAPKISWKTGTSYGNHDAWTIGYDREYTVGVWLGNLNNDPNKNLVGSWVAAPVLFDIFNMLQRNKSLKWFDIPANVGKRRICTESGLPVNENCPHSEEELYIKNRSNIKKCSWHKKIFIDNLRKKRIPTSLLDKYDYSEETVTFYPSELLKWREEKGLNVPEIPDFLEINYENTSDIMPKIIYPFQNQKIIVDSAESDKEIDVKAEFSSKYNYSYIFLDDKYLGKIALTNIFRVKLGLGRHKLLIQDPKGKSDEVNFSIVKKK